MSKPHAILIGVLALTFITPTISSANEMQNSAEQQALATQPSGGRIARSTFTTQVIDREPADSVTELTTLNNQVYYYTELLGMAGQTVTHRWSYDGEVMAEVSFTVGGSRWRVWSSKSLVPGWTGDWKVSVVNEAGDVLGGNRFTYASAPR